MKIKKLENVKPGTHHPNRIPRLSPTPRTPQTRIHPPSSIPNFLPTTQTALSRSLFSGKAELSVKNGIIKVRQSEFITRKMSNLSVVVVCRRLRRIF